MILLQYLNILFLSSLLLLPINNLDKCVEKELSIIPKPMVLKYGEGYFNRGGVVDYLNIADSDINPSLNLELGEEGYILDVTQSKILITAASEKGVFYAKQTLRQIIDENGVRIVYIKDKPRFPYRGFHLDISRNFFQKEKLLKIIDAISMYKMNNFHLHLTDNGGWSFEVEKYPLLTELGSHRAIADWFDWYVKDRKFCKSTVEGAVGGYLTKDDLCEIINYATDRHIRVIPEIDMPAHADPVFAGYPSLNCTNAISGNGEFCPANEDVYVFLENVLNEVMDVFPSEIIHIGGDEARKKEWKKCSRCKAMMKKHGFTDYDQLQVYFIQRIQKIIEKRGRTMAGWDEILKDENLNNAIVYGYRGENYVINAANRNLQTIMTPGCGYYMDWWQADIFKEPYAMGGYSPLYKFYSLNPVPLTKSDLLENEKLIDTERVQKDLERGIKPLAIVEDMEMLQVENKKNIIGVQGCLWTEYVPTMDHLEYMMFPRVLAIAERGWSIPYISPDISFNKENEWKDFTRRVGRHVNKLREVGINAYNLHDAPIISSSPISKEKNKVQIFCEQYNGEIRYTLTPVKKASKKHNELQKDIMKRAFQQNENNLFGASVKEVLGDNSIKYNGPFEVTEDMDITVAVFIDGKLKSYIRNCRVQVGKEKIAEYPTRWPW